MRDKSGHFRRVWIDCHESACHRPKLADLVSWESPPLDGLFLDCPVEEVFVFLVNLNCPSDDQLYFESGFLILCRKLQDISNLALIRWGNAFMLSAAWAGNIEESSKTAMNEYILFMLSPHTELATPQVAPTASSVVPCPFGINWNDRLGGQLPTFAPSPSRPVPQGNPGFPAAVRSARRWQCPCSRVPRHPVRRGPYQPAPPMPGSSGHEQVPADG